MATLVFIGILGFGLFLLWSGSDYNPVNRRSRERVEAELRRLSEQQGRD